MLHLLVRIDVPDSMWYTLTLFSHARKSDFYEDKKIKF